MDKEQMKVRRVCAYPPEYLKLKLQNILNEQNAEQKKKKSLNAFIIEILRAYVNTSKNIQ
jgi:hypothetical protein